MSRPRMKLIMENWRRFIQEAGFERPDWDYREHPEAEHSPRNHPDPIQEAEGDRYQHGQEVVKLMIWRGKPHKLVCTESMCNPVEITQQEYDHIKNNWKNIGPEPD